MVSVFMYSAAKQQSDRNFLSFIFSSVSWNPSDRLFQIMLIKSSSNFYITLLIFILVNKVVFFFVKYLAAQFQSV